MYRLNIYMSESKKPKSQKETALELITALVEDDQQHYTDRRLQWARVAGRLAAMIARWSKNDITIRQELMRIQELRVEKK
jgi:hypothetical protein